MKSHNNAPSRSWISKINNTFIDIAEDLDVDMAMYNLLEYSDSYFMASGSLWNYWNKVSDDTNENKNAENYRKNNSKIVTSKSFEYKTKIIRTLPQNNSRLGTKVTVTFKHLSNFWRSLNLSWINCKTELDLTWLKNCVIYEISRTPEVGGDNTQMQHKQLGQHLKSF